MLSSELPFLANNGTLTITGNGAANTIVSGNNAVPVFTCIGQREDQRIDDREWSGQTLPAASRTGHADGDEQHLQRQHGTQRQCGGTRRRGGAISNGTGATLTLTNARIQRQLGQYGGGIVSDGTLTVTNCTFSGNSAVTDGSGIYVATNGTLDLSNSIVANGVVTGVLAGTTGVDCADAGWRHASTRRTA